MWKTPESLRAATIFFPQAGGTLFNRIQQLLWMNIFAPFFHSRFYQQGKILWRNN